MPRLMKDQRQARANSNERAASSTTNANGWYGSITSDITKDLAVPVRYPTKHNRLRYQFDSRLGPRDASTSNHIAHMYADFQEEGGTTDGDSGGWTDPETGNSVEDDDSTCENAS